MPGNQSRSPSRGRSSRRKSYSRSRSRSRSYSDYSDSFYSDDSYNAKRKSPARNFKSNASSGYNKNSPSKLKKKPPSKKAGGKNTKASGGTVSPRNMEYVTKRMLSARRIKINELKNETEDLTKQLALLQTENRTLRREQHLREKALEKYEYEENDMAHILQKHTAEVRVLKETIRKNKEKNQKLEKSLRDTEDELERTKKLLRKMKGLVEDKELAERDELARKLSKSESLLDEKDKRVRDLERHTEHLSKNHKHEMGIERARHKDTNKQLHELQEKYDKLQIQLREKEKEIEVKNIYANRMLRPPHHLNSSVSSSPAPTAPLAIRERKNSEPDMTPRDKAKMFEQRRREEQRKKKEEQDRRQSEIRQRREEEDRQERERLQEIENERKHRQMEEEEREREEREWRERKEREKLDREDRERREKEEKEKRKRMEEEEEERKWKEERDRRKREAEEMFSSQKKDKIDRERREREEVERRENQEREREEIERRAQDERNRLERDQAEQERRKQKELLLARMKAIDTGNTKASQDSDLFSLSKDKTVTKEEGSSFFDKNNPRGKKDYQFTRPIENMHSGKPAYENVPVSVLDKKKKGFSLFDSEDDSDGGYNPSFGSSRRGDKKPTQKNSFFDSPVNSASKNRNSNLPGKKGDLMADLFGGDTNTTKTAKPSSNGDTIKDLDFKFTSSPQKNKSSFTSSKRESSSTQIYGGGSAFIDENEAPPVSNSGLLPRRIKQPATTIHNRPTVNAVDDFEDEIEEVIL